MGNAKILGALVFIRWHSEPNEAVKANVAAERGARLAQLSNALRNECGASVKKDNRHIPHGNI